jgi:phthalate 4,5-dioxygenase
MLTPSPELSSPSTITSPKLTPIRSSRRRKRDWAVDGARGAVHLDGAAHCVDDARKIKAKSYQVAERGGVVYVYMGERAIAPPLPALEATVLAPDETYVYCAQRECNWLQALEGDIDTSHFSFLHTGKVKVGHVDPDHPERFQLIDRVPRYHVQATDWGAMCAAYRPAQPGQLYYRFAHFVMPFWTLFPNGPLADNIIAQAWVPMDDTM